MADTPDWASLRDTGYVVARGLFSDSQVAALCADYRASEKAADSNYDIRFVSPELVDELTPTLQCAAASAAAGGVDADLVHVGVYISVSSGPGFSQWHQDHESYYALQNHEHYLNVWVPIIKPDVHKSNLSIIPFDALKARSPKLHDRLFGGGAGRFETVKGRHWWVDDSTGVSEALDFHFDELGTAPELAAGDALIMRGDMCHRTQDTSTQRVAVSIRVVQSASHVTRKRLVKGCIVKYIRMSRAPVQYAAMLDCFRVARTNDLTIGEVVAMMREGKVQRSTSRMFPLRLLAEKLRASIA
jgi:hypothetical protein